MAKGESMQRSRQINVIFVIVFLFIPRLDAQDAANEEFGSTRKVEMLVAKILVVDPDDHPVEDATVSPKWILADDGGETHWIRWSEDEFGPLPQVSTGKNGIADVPYPKYASGDLISKTLNLNVRHPDFVSFLRNRDVDDRPAVVKLKRGFRVALSAIDSATGNKIKTNLFGVMSGRKSEEDWKLFKNGMLVSPNFTSQPRQMRVMQIDPGKPILFSSIIKVEPGDDSRVLLRDIRLAIGTRVEGCIDQSVPRPIKNGHVAAAIVRISKSRPNDHERKWTWIDDASISENGSFVFESLPPGEVLQMIAVCDGFVPKQPTKPDVMAVFPELANQLQGHRTLPHLVTLSGDKVTTTIMMQKATSLRVLAKTPDGTLLAGVEIEAIPNQEWFRYGTSVLGAAIRTEQALKANREGNQLPEYENPFTAETDDNGLAIIKSLPPNRRFGLRATHGVFEVPINEFGNRWASAETKGGEINELTIEMHKKRIGTNKDDD